MYTACTYNLLWYQQHGCRACRGKQHVWAGNMYGSTSPRFQTYDMHVRLMNGMHVTDMHADMHVMIWITEGQHDVFTTLTGGEDCEYGNSHTPADRTVKTIIYNLPPSLPPPPPLPSLPPFPPPPPLPSLLQLTIRSLISCTCYFHHHDFLQIHTYVHSNAYRAKGNISS